jgi:hypothetical protein
VKHEPNRLAAAAAREIWAHVPHNAGFTLEQLCAQAEYALRRHNAHYAHRAWVSSAVRGHLLDFLSALDPLSPSEQTQPQSSASSSRDHQPHDAHIRQSRYSGSDRRNRARKGI